MRIGVFSDTHGAAHEMRLAVRQMGRVDFVLHAGDYFSDGECLAQLTGARAAAVVGNCDLRVDGPTERVLQLAGRRILLTHGHLYRVKQDHEPLLRRGAQLDAKILVFGHTHRSEIRWEGEVLLFNPGSLYLPTDPHEASYGILELTPGDVKAQLRHLRYY
ncbi:MAG: metallophosphoesterase [Thermaerobacter sp.]|nr:metallophosphoesterase [Thermaerobacter sp.]